MLLNSDQIKEYIKISPYSKFTQAGVDLSVNKIEVVLKGGVVLTDETIIDKNNYEEVPTQILNIKTKNGIEERECWNLTPGIYSCTFNEGINVPPNAQAKVTHRSSIYRQGNIIESPWWDAGFFCDNMNSTLIVINHMIVEKNARLAQVVFHSMLPPSELYNGQWQGKSTAHGK